MKNPTREIMNRLIDKIYVTKDKKLEIHYRIKKSEVLIQVKIRVASKQFLKIKLGITKTGHTGMMKIFLLQRQLKQAQKK